MDDRKIVNRVFSININTDAGTYTIIPTKDSNIIIEMNRVIDGFGCVTSFSNKFSITGEFSDLVIIQ